MRMLMTRAIGRPRLRFIVHNIAFILSLITQSVLIVVIKHRKKTMLSYDQLLSQIKQLKKYILVKQTELQNFLGYLDQTVFKRFFCFCMPCKAAVAPSFERAFLTLKDYERAEYYLSCLKILEDIQNHRSSAQINHEGYERMELQYKQERKLWKIAQSILSYRQGILQIEAIGSKLKLQHYIFRASKSRNKEAFVLQSTRADCLPTTLRISHSSNQDYWNLMIKVKKLMRIGLRIKFQKMKGLNRQSRQIADDWFKKKICMSIQLSKPWSQQRNSIRRMLQATMASEVSKSSQQNNRQIIQAQLISQQRIQNLNNFEDFEQISYGFYVHKKQERIRKFRCLEAGVATLDWVISQFKNEEHFRLWKQSLCSIFLIAEVPRQSTKIYHEIAIYKDGNEVDYVYMRNYFYKNGCHYFFDKSISTAQYGSHIGCSSRGNIEYCLWRIRQSKDKSIEILVEAEINHLPCVDAYAAMSQQIGQLQNIVLCKNASQKQMKISDNSFYTIVDHSAFSFEKGLQSNEEEQFKTATLPEEEKLSRSSQFLSILAPESNNASRQSYQTTPQHRYQIKPGYPDSSQSGQASNRKFFDGKQCEPNQIGDLVFTNKEKIKTQAGVIMKMLKRIGANFLTGKNILNVSFPIQIFTAETNLQRLCKAMAFGPRFLENKMNVTPIQRMKAAICFAIGNLLLYIDMAKPFNPIIGQTYQGFIDGCPVYGQQTSHHPCISSILLAGRGYFVSANIESTVELSMNSVSGTNSGQYCISFNGSDPTKQKITFTSPPGELSGIIYGVRKLNIIDRSRLYDAQNRLFCELRWGNTKSTATVGRYHDYLQGKIVELNKPASNIYKVKESDKDLVHGYITGRWTQTVYFNDQPIFDINKVRPCTVKDQHYPLQSDSRLRVDRQYVMESRWTEAQLAKEKIQQLQRSDRKLRKQCRFT